MRVGAVCESTRVVVLCQASHSQDPRGGRRTGPGFVCRTPTIAASLSWVRDGSPLGDCESRESRCGRSATGVRCYCLARVSLVSTSSRPKRGGKRYLFGETPWMGATFRSVRFRLTGEDGLDVSRMTVIGLPRPATQRAGHVTDTRCKCRFRSKDLP